MKTCDCWHSAHYFLFSASSELCLLELWMVILNIGWSVQGCNYLVNSKIVPAQGIYAPLRNSSGDLSISRTCFISLFHINPSQRTVESNWKATHGCMFFCGCDNVMGICSACCGRPNGIWSHYAFTRVQMLLLLSWLLMLLSCLLVTTEIKWTLFCQPHSLPLPVCSSPSREI